MQYIKEDGVTKKRGLFTLEITTTALCDLGCTYCFEGEKTDKRRLDNELPVIFKRIDELLSDTVWFQKHYEGLNLSFWGGEPTLNPKFIVEIINKYKDYENIHFHIYTNAFNLNNLTKVVDNVPLERLQVQVSYDGKLLNDKYRVTKANTPTSNQVINNLYVLAKKGVNVSLKSTLPIENMELMSSSWFEFKEIQEMLWKIDKKINVSYSPTIDYVTKVSKEEKDEALVVFRNQFLNIAKQEIEFYKNHNRHLCTWFGGEDQRKHCTAGLSMAAIDQAGDLYACHGAIYSEHKEEMKSSKIADDDFVGKLAAFSQKFEEPVKRVSEDCKNCVATTCMICPVASFGNSQKEDYFDKWTDNWSNNLCGFFKTFGEIDRAVQEINFRSNYGV